MLSLFQEALFAFPLAPKGKCAGLISPYGQIQGQGGVCRATETECFVKRRRLRILGIYKQHSHPHCLPH